MLYQSKQVAAQKAPIEPGTAANPVTSVGEFVCPANLAINDVVEMVIMPASAIPTDLLVVVDDMDTGTTITLDVGFLSGKAGDAKTLSRTCGNEFYAADTTARNGGQMPQVSKKDMLMQVGNDAERGVGFKVAAAAAGIIAGARVRFFLSYIPAPGFIS